MTTEKLQYPALLAAANGFRNLAKGALLLGLLGFSLPTFSADCSIADWSRVQGVAEASDEQQYYGECSLKISPDGHFNYVEGAAFVEDQTPGTVAPPVTDYAARFYFRADQAAIVQSPAELIIFRGWREDDSLAFEVGYSICDGVAVVYLQAGGGHRTDNIPITDPWNELTVFWSASGNMTLRVRGAGEQTRAIPALPSPLTNVQMGIANGTLSLFTGALFYDEFESTRGADPGPKVDVCEHDLVVLNDYVFDEDSPKLCSAESIKLHNVSVTREDLRLETKTLAINGAFSVKPGSTFAVSHKF